MNRNNNTNCTRVLLDLFPVSIVELVNESGGEVVIKVPI